MVQRERWLEDLGLLWTKRDEPWEVEIHAHLPPGSDYGDIDHYVSNLLDTLTGVVYTDDRWVERVILTRTRDAEEPYVDLFLYSSLP